MQVMTCATILWMRWDRWDVTHEAYEIWHKKHPLEQKVFKLWFFYVWNANSIIYKDLFLIL